MCIYSCDALKDDSVCVSASKRNDAHKGSVPVFRACLLILNHF